MSCPVISTCGKGQPWHQAPQLHVTMRQAGVEPNVVNLTNTCGKGQPGHQAPQLFDSILLLQARFKTDMLWVTKESVKQTPLVRSFIANDSTFDIPIQRHQHHAMISTWQDAAERSFDPDHGRRHDPHHRR